MAHYKWQNTMYPAPEGPIKAGIISGDTAIHSTDVMSGSSSLTFGYLDSDRVSGHVSSWTANNTSRVSFTITTNWTAVADNKNNITFTVTTTLDNIARDIVTGTPTPTLSNNSYGRWIHIYNFNGGPELWNTKEENNVHITPKYYAIADVHQIASGVTLTSYQIRLAPGEEASSSSLYVYNKTIGYPSDGDHIYAGVHFINDMPPDYRPGAILKNGEWLSHNRSDGEAHILCSRWSEMRTDNGHSENDNPPSIRMDNNRWTDQLLIGKE